MPPEILEIGPPGLSPGRKRLAWIICLVPDLGIPIAVAVFLATVIMFGATQYGFLGLCVSVILGIPTSLMFGGLLEVLEFPIAMKLLAVVEGKRSIVNKPRS